MARTVGKYRLYDAIGSGGMGSVHLGRLFGSGGFRRIVAVKTLHPQFASDVDFVSAFLDEARLASRIHHPNVVAPLDVVSEGGEVFLVLEHVVGVSLATLAHRAGARGAPIPPRIAATVLVDVLHGLEAAHDAVGDDGAPLGLVHRDVSPQNVLVGRDGTARLLDFGIAKANGRAQSTGEGIVKGKRSYMAPEHLLGHADHVSDLYSAAVVLWELVNGRRLFPDETSVASRVAGTTAIDLPEGPFAAILRRGLAQAPAERFASAREMAIAIEATGLASKREVGDWVVDVGAADLAERAALVTAIESGLDVPDAAPAISEGTETPPVVAAQRSEARWPWRIAFGVGGLVVLGLVVTLVLVARRPSPEVANGAASRPPAATAVASAVVDDPAPAPSASASASVAGPARSAARNPVKRPPAKVCKPFKIDKDGRKVFNEDCLR